MQAFALIRKAVSMTVANGGTLARLTLPVFVLYALLQGLSTWMMTGRLVANRLGEQAPAPDDLSGFLSGLGAMTIALLVMALLAIRVHRFVLEEDTSLGHALAGSIYGQYVLRVVQLTLATIGIFVAIMIPIILVVSGLSEAGLLSFSTDHDAPIGFWILVYGVGLTITVITTRLSLTLPAAAVNEIVAMGESWNKTRGQSLAILIALLVSMGASGAVTQLFAYAIPFATLGWAVQILVGWPFLVLNVVILTTLYGHCVQGRDLQV